MYVHCYFIIKPGGEKNTQVAILIQLYKCTLMRGLGEELGKQEVSWSIALHHRDQHTLLLPSLSPELPVTVEPAWFLLFSHCLIEALLPYHQGI